MANLYPPGAIFCKHCGYCLHGLPSNVCPECGHSFDPADSKTFRTRPLTHRLRWVVRAGVALVLLAAVPMGYWGWLWWGWNKEQPVIARLRAKGAVVTPTTIGSARVRAWMPSVGSFVFVRTQGAYCGARPITDADLQGLENLTELEFLNLSETQVTDASLPAVGRLSKLKMLFLKSTPVTDKGLQNLSDLTQLEYLGLGGPAISGRGLGYLRQNSGLKKLKLYTVQIGDESMPLILSFAKLDEILLERCQFTDASLLKLAGLRALTHLQVTSTRVTEAAMEALRKARPGLSVNNQWYVPPPATAPAP